MHLGGLKEVDAAASAFYRCHDEKAGKLTLALNQTPILTPTITLTLTLSPTFFKVC
jgi:hypothetical protein